MDYFLQLLSDDRQKISFINLSYLLSSKLRILYEQMTQFHAMLFIAKISISITLNRNFPILINAIDWWRISMINSSCAMAICAVPLEMFISATQIEEKKGEKFKQKILLDIMRVESPKSDREYSIQRF